MNRIINLFFLISFIFFFFYIYKYYTSSKNIKNINLNRSNIEIILKKKITNLPVLGNDTENVINFNTSFSEDIKNSEPRSFWNLLKSKWKKKQ